MKKSESPIKSSFRHRGDYLNLKEKLVLYVWPCKKSLSSSVQGWYSWMKKSYPISWTTLIYYKCAIFRQWRQVAAHWLWYLPAMPSSMTWVLWGIRPVLTPSSHTNPVDCMGSSHLMWNPTGIGAYSVLIFLMTGKLESSLCSFHPYLLLWDSPLCYQVLMWIEDFSSPSRNIDSHSSL